MNKATNNYDADSIFPSRLRSLMDEKKVTQAELAKICGVQRQSVAQWREGNTRPEILSLGKIAEFFGVSSDYLIGLTDNKTTDKATLETCATLGITEKSVEFLSDPKNEYYRHGIDVLISQHIDSTPEDPEILPLRSSILQSLTALFYMVESEKDVFINYGEGGIKCQGDNISTVNIRVPEVIGLNPDERYTISLLEAECLIEKSYIDAAISDIIIQASNRNIVRRYKEAQKQKDETT